MELQNWKAIDDISRGQRQQEDQSLLEEFKNAWHSDSKITPIELLQKLRHASPEAIAAISTAHPARAWHDSIDNVDRAYSVLRLSRKAINSLYGVFHSTAVHERERPNLEKTLEIATKEVFAFSFAAASLVAAYRRLISGAPQISDRFEQLVEELFLDSNLREFIKNLRNNFGHSVLIAARPRYVVTLGAQRTVTTELQFDKEELLKGEWNAASKCFIAAAETLDVMQIVSAYFESADNLHRRYLSETGLDHEACFKDLLRLKEARRAMSRENTISHVLQMTKSKSVNPYPHLARFFSVEELQRIRCFNDHSRAQVDYLIQLRDPIGLCSEDVRYGLYRLFQVSN